MPVVWRRRAIHTQAQGDSPAETSEQPTRETEIEIKEGSTQPNKKEEVMAKAPTATKEKRPTLADQVFFANILLYGEPKSGKTTAAAAVARLGRTVYVDAEAGLKRDAIASFGIPVTNIEPFMDITMYALDSLFWELKDGDLPVALVWDSVSESHKKLLEQTVTRTYDRATAKDRDKERYATEIGDYGINTQEMRTLTRQFRDLQCHTIFVALEKRTQDDDGTVKYTPDLTDRLANDLLGYVDVIGHTYTVERKDQDPEYWATFRNQGKFVGGDRFKMLPVKMINPTADRIIAYLTGEMDEDSDPDLAEHRAERAAKRAKEKPVAEPEDDDELDDGTDAPTPKKATGAAKKARPPAKKAG
jgi:hypothetical protein